MTKDRMVHELFTINAGQRQLSMVTNEIDTNGWWISNWLWFADNFVDEDKQEQ